MPFDICSLIVQKLSPRIVFCYRQTGQKLDVPGFHFYGNNNFSSETVTQASVCGINNLNSCFISHN